MGFAEVLQWSGGPHSQRLLLGRERENRGRRSTGKGQDSGGFIDGQQPQALHRGQQQHLQQSQQAALQAALQAAQQSAQQQQQQHHHQQRHYQQHQQQHHHQPQPLQLPYRRPPSPAPSPPDFISPQRVAAVTQLPKGNTTTTTTGRDPPLPLPLLLPPLRSPPSPSSTPPSLHRHTRRLASSVSYSSSSTHRRRSSRPPIANMPPEYRHARSSSMSIANSSTRPTSSVMPRSPPNTSHVPCKFYRQGACQAGNACPFSHELGVASETVCKYFAKGNCKFGPKCANIHVLPDGRRVNYGKNGFTIVTTPLAGSPADPTSPTSAAANTTYNQSSASALTTSLYEADQSAFPSYLSESRQQLHDHQLNLDNGHASESPFAFPESYGSPRDGFAFSPANAKGLSILDAPMPASFDSNGISNAARFPAAPWPSSVPSKFGLESPASSLSNVKDSRTSDTLKLLHSSAFGYSDQFPTAGSPPSSNPFGSEEYFGKRAMHSSRYAKPKMLSSSVPKTNVDRDWEASFAFGDDAGDNGPENYVPENLQDLLTPAEKARRGSMRGENDVNIESLSKYGSPLASSPSRWGSLFQRQKEEEELSRSARNAASPFGHVGSPLRNSTLAQTMGNEAFGTSAPGRPSSARIGSDSMSVLSQQFQRSRIDDATTSSSPRLHPASARTVGPHPVGKDRAMERHVSTGSISSSVTGRFTTPIDEEDPAFVFSMEEDDPVAAARMRKRASAGLGMSSFNSYAGAVTGKGQDGKTKDSKNPSTNGR
ncbi:hypothetical protein ARSEF1564_007035 [Beauveria bassiana]